MANDKSGLYLPLKINLSEWEQSLATADADLQKEMRQMRAAVKDLKLRYDVQIAGAKTAGNDLKALQLEEARLNQLYDIQKQTVEALTRAYKKSVAEKGEEAQASKALSQQLSTELKALNRLEAQQKKNNLGQALTSGLSAISPEFARVRTLTNDLSTQIGKLGGVALTAGKALAGIAVPAGIVTAGVVGIKKLVDGYKETAKASAEANEEVYQLREVLNSSYKEAELLAGAARIDGVNLQALGAAVNTLYKNIDLGNAKGERAVAILEQYGAAITDINGNRKNTIDFFKELQTAYANAESMGRGRDFLTALFGGSSDQFLHFIKGFDYYIAKAEEVLAVNEKEYQLSHDLLDLRKQQQEAERQLQAVRGDAFVSGAVEVQKVHNAGIKEQIKLYEEAKEKLAGYSSEMKNLALAEEGATLAWERFKISIEAQGMQALDNIITKLKSVSAEYQKIKESDKTAGKNTLYGMLFAGADMLFGGINNMSKEQDKVAERAQNDAYMAEVEAMQKAIDEEDRIKEQKYRDEIARKKKEAQENQKVLDKQKEAQEQFYRELRDLRSSNYEREINLLNDRKQKWIDANVAILDVERRYSEEKAQIDKKYYEKAEQERQANLKKAEEASKKEAEMYKKQIEDAKRAREAQISDAQSTIQNAAKVLKYIQRQQAAGTYNEDDVKAYADKLSLKSSGINQSQIDTAYNIGIDKLKELMDSRTRLYGRFADVGNANAMVSNLIGFKPQQQIPQAQQVQQAPININLTFDNIVVEDQGSIQRLADKVADTITPVIEQALQGGANYGY